MYLPDKHMLVVCPPKTGTSSLIATVQDRAPRPLCKGHMVLSAMMAKLENYGLLHAGPPRVVCVVRDPVDRFLSAINHQAKNYLQVPGRQATPITVVKRWLARIADDPMTCRHRMFEPQALFLDRPDLDWELIRFENFPEAVKRIGSDTPLHLNASPKLVTRDDLANEGILEDVERMYEMDQALRKRAV